MITLSRLPPDTSVCFLYNFRKKTFSSRIKKHILVIVCKFAAATNMRCSWRVTIIVLSMLNTFLHGLGCWLLFGLYKNGRKTVQQMYLINLGLCECLMNIIRSLQNILIIVYLNSPSINIYRTNVYLNFIAGSGLYYLYSLSMFFITGDRLLSIIFAFKYNISWNIHRTRKLLAWTWFISFSICFIVTIGLYYSGLDFGKIYESNLYSILYLYIPTFINVTFLFFALSSYSFMFRRYFNSRRRFPHPKSNGAEKSIIYIFRNSRFFVSILVISSFLILMVIPSLIQSFSHITKTTLPEYLTLVIYISIVLSDTADGIIYVFMQESVRKFLFQRLSSQTNNSESSSKQFLDKNVVVNGKRKLDSFQEASDKLTTAV